MVNERNFFQDFVNMDVSKYVEKKQNLDYIEWAASVMLLKNKYPMTTWNIHKDENGRPWFTDAESNSGWVEVTLRIPELGLEQEDSLAIMDLKNNPYPIEKCNSVTANKAVRRCLAKTIAETTGIGFTLYLKSEGTMDSKEIDTAREKLSEMYKKKVNLSAEAKKQAEIILKETNEAINSAIDDVEKLQIYTDAKKKIAMIRK